MKQSEARILIISEWDRWISTQAVSQDGPTGKDSLKFFHELQDVGSSLLDFQSRGQDKWRIIHAWLLDAERLCDDWISIAPRIVPTRRPRPLRAAARDNRSNAPRRRRRRLSRRKRSSAAIRPVAPASRFARSAQQRA
mgnify:CR=1 FL=1